MNKKPTKINLTSDDLLFEKSLNLQKYIEELSSQSINLSDKFSFTWAGKSNAIKSVLIPSRLTLNPKPEESIKWDESENLFIEGDNLEVLKLLQKAYFEKVKMIYIDPPYNTGHDFVYNDDFSSPLDNYLKQTGQKTESGESTTTNKETNGRYHSDWLSMMYPRLKLAWNLLREDGVIFVSIDDNEVHHLRMLMDEIFGEENFIGTITWEKRTKAQNTETAREQFQSKTEYVLSYKKLNEKMRFNLEITGQKVYDKNDDKGWYRLKVVEEMSAIGMRGRQSMIYPILGVSPRDGFQWKVGVDTVQFFQERGDVEVIDGKAYFRIRPDDENLERFSPFWSHFFDKDTYGTAETGKSELTEVLGTDVHEFETVKPVALIQKLIFHTTKNNQNDIILDFFAGSGTTAHAVLAQNELDGGNRKFITVQLPEKIDTDTLGYKYGFKTILDITKTRIKNVINGYGKNPKPINSGFKFFILSESNYPENTFVFNPQKSSEENQQAFITYLDKAKQSQLFDKENDISIIYENIVKEGLSLNSKVDKILLGKNNVYQITDGEQHFFVCLERKLTPETVKALTDKLYKDKLFICLEGALDDTMAANLALNLDLKTI
ncbi:MAG: site-specific DNA-methyltransferase [Patescibacteria group bacterium]